MMEKLTSSKVRVGAVVLGLLCVGILLTMSMVPATSTSAEASQGGRPESGKPEPSKPELSEPESSEPESSEPESSKRESGKPEKIYKIGIAPADVETPVESYLDTINGINAQCERVNQVIESACCARFDIGCHVRYTCEVVDVDHRDILDAGVAQSYFFETGYVHYPMHHGAIVRAVLPFLGSLRLYSEELGGLVVAYTRHRIRVDDESTKDARRKISTGDLRFYFLGRILPGETARGGKEMILDYYVTKDGMMLSVSPTLDSSLTLALAEFRSGLYSFEEKVFTGTGSRDLFELGEGGAVVPNITGCLALTEREPPHFSSLLKDP